MLMLYFLNLVKGSAQQDLDHCFQVVNQSADCTQFVTQSAFTQARQKLSATAFQELNTGLTDHFYQHATIQTWRGFRVCAVDGTKLRLPDEHEIRKHFGVQKGRNSATGCPMALASVYYDVLNQVVIDSSLNPARASERTCAYRHLESAGANDLVLFDRGYPAFWLFAALRHQELKFCMRVKTGLEKIYGAFEASGQTEAVIEMPPNQSSIKQCQEQGLSSNPMRLRLIRVDLKSETEVLVTNLLDDKTYPAEIFKGLYQLRWGVEEHYKRQKQWVEMENFSGKSVLSVQQDFFAKMVTLNITAIMVAASQPLVNQDTAGRKHRYRIHFAQALSKMKDVVVSLIHRPATQHRLIQLLQYLAKSIEAVRNHRSYPRKPKTHKNIRFVHVCYTRCR
jgi:Transposase DDE domain